MPRSDGGRRVPMVAGGCRRCCHRRWQPDRRCEGRRPRQTASPASLKNSAGLGNETYISRMEAALPSQTRASLGDPSTYALPRLRTARAWSVADKCRHDVHVGLAPRRPASNTVAPVLVRWTDKTGPATQADMTESPPSRRDGRDTDRRDAEKRARDHAAVDDTCPYKEAHTRHVRAKKGDPHRAVSPGWPI